MVEAQPAKGQKGQFSIDCAYDGPPDIDATDETKGYYTVARFAIQNDHYRGLHQVWTKPIFFLVGKQWIKWNEKQATYAPLTDVPQWRQQPVTNWTFAVYRALVAKLTKQRPALDVIPPSGDSEDEEAARLGEALLVHLWRQLKCPRKFCEAVGWILATGNVGFLVEWDDDAGDVRPRSVLVEVPDPMDPSSTIDIDCACDEQGEPHRKDALEEGEAPALDGGLPYDLDRQPDEDAIGEISLTIESPLGYRWNPEATSEDDAEEMYLAKLWPTQKVCRDFDVSADDIKVGGGEAETDAETLADLLSGVAAAAPDPFNNTNELQGQASAIDIDRTLVIKYYGKPDAKAGWPRGRHWIVAGGTKVWPKADDPDYPNGEAELPFGFWPPIVACIDTPIPGQPQGLGVLSQVVPLNEKYNFHDGKIGEYHTTSAMGGVIWVTSEDKNIQITSEPGQVKVSRGYGLLNKPPIREKLEALPAAVYEERNVIASTLRAIAGLSEVDMGQKPDGVSAGRAFLVLQEASAEAIAPTLTALENATEEVGRRKLVIAQRKYSEERTIKVRGAKGKWEVRSFRNADLRDGLDVRVQSGSMFPWSKSAQWDTRLNVLTTLPQLVTKPDGTVDRRELAKFLDSGVPGLGEFESDEDPDLVETQREHAMFEEYDPTDPTKPNQLPQLAVWQNQPVHQQEHFDFMKRDFARFLRWSPAAQMAFMEHLRLTTEAVDMLVQGAMGAGEQGAPPAGDPNAPPGDEGGAGGLALVKGGGPKPGGKQGHQQLTRGDRAAAGLQ